MRTFLLALLAGAAVASPASGATRNFAITSFTKVRVEGPYKIALTTGVPPFARASGSATALDRIAIETSGDTLVVRADPNAWGGYPGEDPGPVEVSIGTHDLSNVTLTGAGSLAINRVQGLSFALSLLGSGAVEIDDVAADQMQVGIAGTASARLKGRANHLAATLRGLSSLDAASLDSHDAEITADGSATVAANATNTARVEASGPATIRLSGRPSCTLKVAGSASVTGCR